MANQGGEMKTLLVSIFLVLPAMAWACPSSIDLKMTDHEFDGAYENSGFSYRASNVELLKNELAEIDLQLIPHPTYFDPSMPNVGGCSYYQTIENGDKTLDAYATLWPGEEIDVTLIHEIRDADGKLTQGNFIDAFISPSGNYFYDVTYGDQKSTNSQDHSFAIINRLNQKINR